MKLKQKIKSFFKTKDASEHGVELFRMFILPFMRAWNAEDTVDNAIEAFFDVQNRKIYWGTARRDFKMPGQLLRAGNRPYKKVRYRSVFEGQKMLVVADRRTATARVDIKMEDKEVTFLLARPDLEMLKDYVELKEE